MDREVTARLQALGFRVEHDSFGNVIAKLAGAGESVILSAHLDTVEPGRGIRPNWTEIVCAPTALLSWAGTVRPELPLSWKH